MTTERTAMEPGMSTFETLKAELAQKGQVALHYSSSRQLLRGLTTLNFAAQRAPQIIVTAHSLWTTTVECPEDGFAWSRIRDVHLLRHGLVSSVELTIEGEAPAARSTMRVPGGLTINAQNLALWLATELSARGEPL